MPYVASDGSIQENRQPFTIDYLKELISGFFTFIYLFFATLIGWQSSSESKNRYQSDYRSGIRDGPGSGRGNVGGGAPRQRNIGRLGGSGGPSCPPMAGGG